MPLCCSSKWSHSNVTNYVSVHKQLHFVHFPTKSIRHRSRCGNSSLNDSYVGGLFRKLKGAWDYHFQQWTHASSLGV
jgi:ribosome-associated toxin RatA of RatAB toxin-antitoxin module